MIEREVVTVCKQIMKSFLCMMLLFGCVLTNIIVVEPILGETSFSISFQEPYVLPNETLTLQVEGANVEECSITWYRDGQEISAMKNQLTYQVKDSDMQELIKVEVIYQDQSQSVQMLISKLPPDTGIDKLSGVVNTLYVLSIRFKIPVIFMIN